jgi:hypothetical protein
MNVAALLILALVGCDKEKAPPPLTETDPGEEDTADSAAAYLDLTGQFGSVGFTQFAIDRDNEVVRYGGAGIFADDLLGVINGGGCGLAGDFPCLSDQGALDGDVVVYDMSAWAPETIDVGDPLIVGGVDLDYDDGNGFDLYFGAPSEWAGSGVSLDGDLAPYEGSDAIAWVDEMEVSAPPPLESIEVTGVTPTVSFAWTAATAGDVFLTWGSGGLHLTDDGAYDLDVSALGLTAPFDLRTLQLKRSITTEIDAAGNELMVTTTSIQQYFLKYSNTEGYTELVEGVHAAETCEEALLLAPVAPGMYWGSVEGDDDDHDVGEDNPTTGYPSPGPDEVIPVALLDGQELTVTLRHPALDASVYLLDDGCDADDPLDGIDDTFRGEVEEFSYTARSDRTVYVVVDSYDDEDPGGYGLTLTVTGP